MSVKKRWLGSSSSCKRGQITVFIIIGIIILFSFAGIMYFTKTVIKDEITAEGDPIIGDVPQQFQAIQAYTDKCLQQIGQRGLLILGDQGGYIYPDLVGEYSVANPTDSDGLNLEPMKVPYWHYNNLKNLEGEIEYTSLKPELLADEDPEFSIESQLSRFVEEKIDTCLNEFAPFSNQGFEVDYSAEQHKEVLVTVGENSVNFWLKTEFTAQKGTAESEFNEFYVKLPVKLKQIYQTASEIAAVQFEHNFLERQALDLISIYSDVDINKLPPTEDFTYESIPTISWSSAEVEQNLQNILNSNVPLMRYYGSDNFYRYEYKKSNEAVLDLTDLYQKSYDDMILPLELGQDLNINFDYFNWPIYFNTNDDAGVIKPTNIAVNFYRLNFATQHYYTTYDLSYPVLITLQDADAFFGQGYKFNFALETNLRNNDIVKSGYVEPTPVSSLTQSMVCDEDKRSTELIKTIVVDSANREPLEAVQIGFSIPDVDDCILGETNSMGEFASEYPAVIGGVGSYVKEGYLTDFYPVNTYDYQDQPGIIGYAVAGFPEEIIEMHPFRYVKVKVKVKNFQMCIDNNCPSTGILSDEGDEQFFSYKPELLDERHRWVFPNGVSKLNENNTAIVILSRVSDLQENIFNDDYVAFANVNGDTPSEMELVPGKYKVTITINSGESITIPKSKRCRTRLKRSCTNLEETVMDGMMIGQVDWDTEPYYFTITPEQLYSTEEITFYAAGINLKNVPSNYLVLEDNQAVAKLGNWSKQIRAELEPRYS